MAQRLPQYLRYIRENPWVEAIRWSLSLAIILMPFGHLLGVSMLLVTTALSAWTVQWRIGGQAVSLCLPLVVAYAMIIGAEFASPNTFGVTLETAFNYLPLLLLPVIFAGCWRAGIDIQYLIKTVLFSSVLMALVAAIEVFVFDQAYANGNVFEQIAIAPSELALVAFLYGLIIASALLVSRHPFANKIAWPYVLLGLGCCMGCIILTGTRTMFVPIVVVTIVCLFALAFNSSKRWLAPSLLVTLVLAVVAASALPVVQDVYNGLFQMMNQTMTPPRTGLFAEKISKWIAGWDMAQQRAIFGYGNIHASKIALSEFVLAGWPGFYPAFHFDNAYIDHLVLFGGLGLAGLLIVLMAPLVVVGPIWFRLYTAIMVLGTSLFALLGRFLNNDITGGAMLIMWLSLLLTQSLVGRKTT